MKQSLRVSLIFGIPALYREIEKGLLEAVFSSATENLLRMIKDSSFDVNYEFEVDVVPRRSM